MTAWTSQELDRIGSSVELELASLRADGTLADPVTIWVVRDGDELYVRAYRGRGGAWFQTTLERRQGRIRAGGIAKDVAFVEETEPDVNDRIDAGYRTKYRGHEPRHVDYMVEPRARAATLRLVPLSAGE